MELAWCLGAWEVGVCRVVQGGEGGVLCFAVPVQGLTQAL